MADWYQAPAAAAGDDFDSDDDILDAPADGDDNVDLTAGSYLKYPSVTDVSSFFRGAEMSSVFKLLGQYSDEGATKNSLTKDDDEYHFVLSCSNHVLKMEVEKSKVHKWLRDHYDVRFPEMAMLVPDALTYARCVTTIANRVDDLTPFVDSMRELMPSQILCALIAAAATTKGRELDDAELQAVLEGAQELIGLEEAKQVLLEYMQTRSVLICPNMCAFLGTAIASQLFAIAGSIDAIANLDPHELSQLGSQQASKRKSQIKVRTAGFLINVDLVSCQPPELRTKALRLVAARTVVLARIDANRRAPDSHEGLRAREDVKRKMLEWTDPLIQQIQSRIRGLSNKTYERRTRKRAVDKVDANRARKAVNRAFSTR